MTGWSEAGFVDQFGGAIFEVLEDLFHDSSKLVILFNAEVWISNSRSQHRQLFSSSKHFI
jgi:hypothetical protein